MKILIFLNRIALICNICFILAEIMRYSADLRLNPIYSTVVVLGYASLLLNSLIAVFVILMLITRRSLFESFPRWLLIINFLFLIAQLFIFLS
jgi:hypothetical protein